MEYAVAYKKAPPPMTCTTREPQNDDAMSEKTAGQKPKRRPEPEHGPRGPRTPYPVDEPVDPRGPGSEPDYIPDTPAGDDLPKF